MPDMAVELSCAVTVYRVPEESPVTVTVKERVCPAVMVALDEFPVLPPAVACTHTVPPYSVYTLHTRVMELVVLEEERIEIDVAIR